MRITYLFILVKEFRRNLSTNDFGENAVSFRHFRGLLGKHYMVAHHIVVRHKLIEHCAQRLVSSTHFSKLLFSVLSTPRLSLVSFYVLLCPY